jgi:hypothetical protein
MASAQPATTIQIVLRGGCDAAASAIQIRKSVVYGDSRPPDSQTTTATVARPA